MIREKQRAVHVLKNFKNQIYKFELENIINVFDCFCPFSLKFR